MPRVSKENYYLDIAQTVSARGTCLRRKFGAIIVKNDSIVSTGYAGAPRGRANCCDMGSCLRDKMNIPRGERYELCRSVHAEMNAIIAAPREQMLGADLYLTGINPGDCSIHQAKPCPLCARMIIQAGIRNVYLRQGEGPDNYMVVAAKDLTWYLEDEAES